jgi:hypothetical protein
VLYRLGYRGLLIALVCLSPSAFTNQIFGQYGMVCSALLIAGLMWSRERPILAGICLGLLTIKPHFGILVPFCLLAARDWKTIAVATCVTITLIAASCIAFGAEVWSQYISYTMPMMRETLNLPYPQGFHANAVTGFVLLRGLGASLEFSYSVQVILALLCAVSAYVLWRNPNTTREHKVVLTALLTLPASLYLYQYDVGFVAFAAALLALNTPNRAVRWMAWLAWSWPLYSHLLVGQAGIPPIYILIVSGLIYLVIKDQRALTES